MAFPDTSFFDAVYTGPAPWDLEAAQPDLLFEPPVRRELARELDVALPPGGRYYMLGFAIEIPSAASKFLCGWGVPMGERR